MRRPKQAAVTKPDFAGDDNRYRLLHMLQDPSEHFISEFSKWKDATWRYSKQRAIYWDFPLPDGSLLTDISNFSLLDSFKRFIYSLTYDCRSGIPSGTGTLPNRITSLRVVAEWMVRNHHRDFSTLDRQAFEEFIEDWISRFLNDRHRSEYDEEEEDEEDLIQEALDGFGPIYRAIQIWARMWGQTPALEEAGIQGLPEDPLGGISVLKYTKQIFDFVRIRIPQLPDEVAIPVMNQANKWVEQRADDVIRFTEHCTKFYNQVIQTHHERHGGAQISHAQFDEFGEFSFSIDPDTGAPWHETVIAHTTTTKDRKRGFTKIRYWLPVAEVKKLISDLFGACTIVIHSESGMRMGELLSLPAGKIQEGGSHDAFIIRSSITGLNELFFLRSLLKKDQPEPVPEEWLAGARPVGSSFIPGPIKAVWVLQRLFESWREFASQEDSNFLLVTMTGANGLPARGSRVVHASSNSVRIAQRNFIANYVDLSSLPQASSLGEDLTRYRDTRGRCLQTYQWRKSYAMYVIRTDRRMTPAIATQFKHVSVAITENAYITNNPELLRETNSQQALAAAAFMYRRVVGLEPSGGRVGKIIDRYADLVREVIGDSSRPEGIRQLQEWCEQRGIRVFPSPHGKCFLRIAWKQAKCHEVSGTIHWNLRRPNYKTREPDLCAGCACFGVDLDHAEFWINRYVENETAWRQAKKRGLTRGFRVIQERAGVAANMLRVLGIDLPSISVE